MTGVNKEAQLQQALESDNPVTDLPIAVEVDYFRLAKAKYFVPVSVRIPGSALAFRNKGAKAATELDFIAEIRDARGRPASAVRDTIPLKVDEATAGQVTASRSNTIPGSPCRRANTVEVRGARERRRQSRHVRVAFHYSRSRLRQRPAPEFRDPEQPGASVEGTDRRREE